MTTTNRPSPPLIRVAAGILVQDGRVLIARRPSGTHLGGLWEFPGGKCEPGETMEACLHRELWEELAVRVTDSEPLCVVRHDYPGKSVELHFFRCRIAEATARPLPGSEVRWVAAGELSDYEFPVADRAVIERLQRSEGDLS